MSVRKNSNKHYPSSAVTCHLCKKTFDRHPNRTVNENSLRQHNCSITHRSQDLSCPLCGDTRFRSIACATAHVEGGSCSACKGAENGKNAVWKFVANAQNRALHDVVLNPQVKDQLLMLGNGSNSNSAVTEFDINGNDITNTNGSNNNNNDIMNKRPDNAYHCRECNRSFNSMGALLQHNQMKHNESIAGEIRRGFLALGN